MSQLLVSYEGESSGPGCYRDITAISFDGGQDWWSWTEDFERVWCPDAEERGEVVILEDGDMVFFESAYEDGEIFFLVVDTDDDELVYNIQERIYPT